jgi:hypothetical protein
MRLLALVTIIIYMVGNKIIKEIKENLNVRFNLLSLN